MFFIYNKKSYYKQGDKFYRCSISADKVFVDFGEPTKIKAKPKAFYTIDEIRHFLNIRFIDAWDAENKKVIRVSNQTISSLKANQETAGATVETKEEPKEEPQEEKTDVDVNVQEEPKEA